MTRKYTLLTEIAALRDESERLELKMVSHFLDLAVEELGDALENPVDKQAPVAIPTDMLKKYFNQDFSELTY